MLVQRWNGSNWYQYQREVYLYELAGQISEETASVRLGSSWYEDWRMSYSYDDNGNLEEQLFQLSGESGWHNLWRELHSYTEPGSLLSKTHQLAESESWLSDSRLLYSYTPQDQVYDEIFQTRAGGQWLNDERKVYSYTSQGWIESLTHQLWDYDHELWLDQTREISSYNLEGLQNSWRSQTWSNGSWDNELLRLIAYDSWGHPTQIIEELWVGSTYYPLSHQVFDYDVEGHPESMTFQDYLYDEDDWQDSYQELYAFDGAGNQVETISRSWDSVEVSWLNQSKYNWFYPLPTAVEHYAPIQFSLLQNYPNPFNPSTRIRYALAEQGRISLVIYNLRGQEMLRLEEAEKASGQYEILWNGQNQRGRAVEAGVYLCRLEALNFSETIKIVYIK